jgi:molybdate transport system ATP-binding protein
MVSDRGLVARVRVEGELASRTRLDVDLVFGAGITAVMGDSGAGKTTLLSSIAGLVRPNAGRIELNGETLFDADRGSFVPAHRRRISLVFQSLALFPHLRVWENVAYGVRRAPKKIRRERALEWLERAQVRHVADRLPETLSGGEGQRVALARALAAEPRLLLLDEPFSAMDAELRTELGTALLELVRAAGVPAVLVTHDERDAERLAEHIIQLEFGRVALELGGSPG